MSIFLARLSVPPNSGLFKKLTPKVFPPLLAKKMAVIRSAVPSYADLLSHVGASEDRNSCLAAVSSDGLNLKLHPNFSDDRVVVGRAVEQNGLALEFAHASLRGDRDVVRRAVECNGLALKFASLSLREDRILVGLAVENNGLAMEFVGGNLDEDFSLALAAVERNGFALQFCSDTLKGDVGIVLAALAQKQAETDNFIDDHNFGASESDDSLDAVEEVIIYAAPQLQCELCLLGGVQSQEMPSSTGSESHDESTRARNSAVIAAVRRSGHALQFCSEDLRADRDVVVAAVSSHGAALQDASDELRGDKEVVLAAAMNDGAAAMRFASPEFFFEFCAPSFDNGLEGKGITQGLRPPLSPSDGAAFDARIWGARQRQEQAERDATLYLAERLKVNLEQEEQGDVGDERRNNMRRPRPLPTWARVAFEDEQRSRAAAEKMARYQEVQHLKRQAEIQRHRELLRRKYQQQQEQAKLKDGSKPSMSQSPNGRRRTMALRFFSRSRRGSKNDAKGHKSASSESETASIANRRARQGGRPSFTNMRSLPAATTKEMKQHTIDDSNTTQKKMLQERASGLESSSRSYLLKHETSTRSSKSSRSSPVVSKKIDSAVNNVATS